MRTFDLIFAAGETKTLAGGRFLILINAVTGVDIDYFVGGTNNNENATNVTSGYYYDVDDKDDFTSVRITSALAQTITGAISRGKGGYNTGATSVTGSVITIPTGKLRLANQSDFLESADIFATSILHYTGWMAHNQSGIDKYINKISFAFIDRYGLGLTHVPYSMGSIITAGFAGAAFSHLDKYQGLGSGVAMTSVELNSLVFPTLTPVVICR